MPSAPQRGIIPSRSHPCQGTERPPRAGGAPPGTRHHAGDGDRPQHGPVGGPGPAGPMAGRGHAVGAGCVTGAREMAVKWGCSEDKACFSWKQQVLQAAQNCIRTTCPLSHTVLSTEAASCVIYSTHRKPPNNLGSIAELLCAKLV